MRGRLALAAAAACAAAAPLMLPMPPAGAQEAAPVVTSLTLFAGTPTGLYRSRDWGGSWEPAATEARTWGLDGVGAVRDIVPIGPQVFLGGDGGVYSSEDFGQTWRRTPLDAPVVRVLPSRYLNADPTVFAATATGLRKSSDGGRSFDPPLLKGTAVHRLEWPGPALVAATSAGVLVSNDAGATFTGPGAGLPGGDVRALALSSFYAADPVLFAGVGSAGVYRSSDGGQTWSAAGLAGQRVSDLAWMGPFLYAVSDEGVARSQDLGRTWEPLASGLTAAATRILFPLMPDSGAEVFLGTRQGVFRSGDGGQSWRPSGMAKYDVLCLATFPQASSPGRRR